MQTAFSVRKREKGQVRGARKKGVSFLYFKSQKARSPRRRSVAGRVSEGNFFVGGGGIFIFVAEIPTKSICA